MLTSALLRSRPSAQGPSRAGCDRSAAADLGVLVALVGMALVGVAEWMNAEAVRTVVVLATAT